MAELLFDFDGVLTDQAEEADRVLEIFTERLVSWGGLDDAASREIVQEAKNDLTEEPWRHGWISESRVSAFANEDYFVRNAGVANWLDACAKDGDSDLRAVLRCIEAKGASTFVDLCRLAYDAMAAETDLGKHHPLDPAAGEFFERLLSKGRSIVIVSNSGTTRIVHLLASAGIEASEHNGDFAPRVRVRGGARKFDLGEPGPCFEIEKYAVETSRPSYEKILLEEQPKLVIGDVFSLDLALPIQLREDGVIPLRRILLRAREYTPEWSSNHVETRVEGGDLIRSIAELEAAALSL